MEDQDTKPVKLSFCHSSFLYNNLQNSRERTLVIDTRDSLSYKKHHIVGSINLTDHKIHESIKKKNSTSERIRVTLSDVLEILNPDEVAKFSNRRRCFCFIVMSENSLPKNFLRELKRLVNTEEHEDSFQVSESKIKTILIKMMEEVEEKDSILNSLEIFKILQKDRVRELFLLLDGGSSFFNKYPYLAKSISNDTGLFSVENSLLEHDFPHDILDGRLFLGSFHQSAKHCLVSNLKITHILNVTLECHNVHEDKGVKYLKIPILDEDDKKIDAHFEEAYLFIEKALLENNNNVLVHCAKGKSRSATIVIMYLMKRFCWSYDKAFSFVKRKREIVDPNEGFVQQLQNFEGNNHTFVNK